MSAEAFSKSQSLSPPSSFYSFEFSTRLNKLPLYTTFSEIIWNWFLDGIRVIMYAMRLFPSSPGTTTVRISCCLVTGDPRPKEAEILVNTGMQCPQHMASGRPTLEAWVAASSPSESPGNRWSPRLKYTAQIHNRKRGLGSQLSRRNYRLRVRGFQLAIYPSQCLHFFSCKTQVCGHLISTLLSSNPYGSPF